ncbi:bifunctional phosphoribosylaminoimidazolecarboxamide formyltransferase/IMP cyclohydrolase [Brevundimonas sp. BAL450]|uniref:Bifunctional purine biosynthesis protein PurH n=1 Tax=Brevundimonas abyssalis TAR-001 TaxID=1391729 RepID=A0A8E0KKM6_9CAUL|nr:MULTISPECIES: bifunctional phosphoribosylaminoimidazolecarboxamide formyltransferase/IMP cyclohydrolase [Brevundimonas]MBG7616282.1 bifunctional phosphoribosylaminoimidazolecarboxamide formyltransferase/IMP cyclohydrolase [Brevundimonas sp. BAL450]GAD58834.1 IMP cyclohydrolase / phosphoribosylaminoimidazolecarboxamide formyltransferase [Brevundimonas abyssalis TAR-001]
MPAAPDFPPAPDAVKPVRALISLSDKSGLEDVARALAELGVELVSTGGTRAAIEKAGLPVKDVADLTGFPEMMDGRVKTLHPVVHGGLLGVRDAPEHAKAMAEHGIGPIDLVWIDLYPFEATIAGGGDFASAVENIDIGGPAMIRSSAKNHGYVAVCVDRESIDEAVAALKADGSTSLALRKRLAARAFARTAAYDAAVSGWFAGQVEDAAPARKTIAGSLAQTLRYGENPHQAGAFYRTSETRPGVANARQLQGKELGYNNIADADAAYELVAEFEEPACVIVKHANPCGVAVGKDLSEAYARALECDAVSAFGGVVAVNRPLTAADATLITGIFTEVVIAPGADEAAKAVFAAKKNLRLLITDGLPDPLQPGQVFRSVAGGLLVQSRDLARITPADLKIVTKRQPTDEEVRDMLFAFTVAKHVKSNAIVYARAGQTAGIGAGQMNRRDSARIAAIRAKEAGEAHAKQFGGLAHSLAQGSACASEAFFPFADGLLEAVAAGATAVIQPGGSIRDDEVIAAADDKGVAMAFTGVRVFRH